MKRSVDNGKHRFTPVMWGLCGRGISRTVRFDKSCIYDLGNANQQDWNKLFGICGIRGPHYNSYRFGWRYNGEFIELSAYLYYHGTRHILPAGEVSLDWDYHLEIRQNSPFIEWYVNGQYMAGIEGKLPLIGFKLGPYFGGDEAAPHKMILYV